MLRKQEWRASKCSLNKLITYSKQYPTAKLPPPYPLRYTWLTVGQGLLLNLQFLTCAHHQCSGLLRPKSPPGDHTSWDPHTKQLCKFRQILSSRRTAVCISALKWSYHRGCRPTQRSDTFSPPRRRLPLLVTYRQDSHAAPLFFSSHQTVERTFSPTYLWT